MIGTIAAFTVTATILFLMNENFIVYLADTQVGILKARIPDYSWLLIVCKQAS